MKHEQYLILAEEISKFSKCLRGHFAAIIVKNDIVIGTGYCGPARGVKHCDPCLRENEPIGVGYHDKCLSVHAEANALIQAGGRERCLGATMYIGSHNRKLDGSIRYNNSVPGFFSCNQCARLIINAEIEQLVQQESPGIYEYNIPSLVKAGKLT